MALLLNLLFNHQNFVYYITIIIYGCVYGTKRGVGWRTSVAHNKDYGAFYPQQDLNFCKKTCTFQNKTRVPHVACKCNNIGIEHLDCVTYKKKNIVDLRVSVITYLNNARGKIAGGHTGFPPASDLRIINYDIALEYVARCTATKCAFEHDPCRFTLNHKHVQQLIYVVRSPTKISIEDIINRALISWLWSFKKFPSKINEGNLVGSWPAWAVLLWNEATHIGCSMKYLPLKKPYTIFFVCNIAGQNDPALTDVIYRIGDACTNCHRKNPCNTIHKELCGKLNDVPIADLPRFENHAVDLKMIKLFLFFFILVYII